MSNDFKTDGGLHGDPPFSASPCSATIDIELYKNVRHQYDLRLQEIESLRSALEEIRSMATARKVCIRMPDGRMLDTFCRHALSPNADVSDRRDNPKR